MSTPANPEKHQRSWPAIVGWGSIAVFAIGFVWLVRGQLGEEWGKKEPEAIKIVQEFKPDGALTLNDMTKVLQSLGTDVALFVGEFSWKATQKDGPEYEVSLTWREGNSHKQAIWRTDLEKKDIRPQGDEAQAFPRRAAEKQAK